MYACMDECWTVCCVICSPGVTISCNSNTDLATQMRYVTDITSSPQLKRSSKVLSWISESEEMFDLEGTGQLYTSARETESDGCKWSLTLKQKRNDV